MFGIASLSSFSVQPLSIIVERYRSLSVRTMMSRSIDWPLRERALDLSEVLGVRVDVLGVDDVDAELLRERLERRPLLRLLVDVDVERPVREAQRVGELSRSPLLPPLPLLPPQAASEAGHRTARPRAEGGAARAVPLGSGGRSWLSSSGRSTTKVASGLEADGDRVSARTPLGAPGFHVLDVDGQPAGGRVDDVLRRDADVRRSRRRLPASEFTWPSPMRIFSGRMPTATRPERALSASRATLTSGPPSRRDRVRPGDRRRAAGSRRRGSRRRTRSSAARRARSAGRAARRGRRS